MEVDGGGWTVFQRRVNGNVDFWGNWTAYVNGFGSMESSFWIGLEAIHEMTKAQTVTLRIDLKDKDGNTGYAKYSNFKVGSAQEKYKLTIGQYTGDIGDSLRQNDQMYFTTEDSDNDKHVAINCASRYHGPWWHNHCFLANLNNHFVTQSGTNDTTTEAPGARRMSWYDWKNSFGTITWSEMKLRAEN